ncbi:MAG TPA: LacI family DNA-binding transcriptional regulator [Rectinemataceae bacterium]|nr:LacI family DNA-binding transcriptional regulator [Rectinemataceae bacterium]
MTSIKDLARLAGVSASTISRAVNNKKYVKPEIRERIMELVKETGYVPNNAARAMVLKRTFTVGIVIPDTFNMFQRQLFSTIERSLEGFGFHTSFFFVVWEPESELRCLRRLKAEKLDGVIMVHEAARPEFYDYLAKSQVPTVLCTFSRGGFHFPSVHVDEEAAARTATEHLIGLGHRRIGLISGTHFSFGAQRASGYRAALAGAGIGLDEADTVLMASYTPEEGRSGMRCLLERGRGLTAVFASTDELAIGAVRALYEAGLSVPRDVSVIGLDDIDISAYLSPGLTTVRQPIREIGRRTAEIMARLIEGEAGVEGEAGAGDSVFGHELILRESTARPAGQS